MDRTSFIGQSGVFGTGSISGSVCRTSFHDQVLAEGIGIIPHESGATHSNGKFLLQFLLPVL
jgi:hypothetical protein